MVTFVQGLLIGGGIGLVLTPVIVFLFFTFKNAVDRRKIKRMIKKGQFLIPLEETDYNSKVWAKEINIKEQTKSLEFLNDKIFHKHIEK